VKLYPFKKTQPPVQFVGRLQEAILGVLWQVVEVPVDEAGKTTKGLEKNNCYTYLDFVKLALLKIQNDKCHGFKKICGA